MLGNLTGQYVHMLDLTSVEAGVYYLQMNVANAAQVLRIVKQ